MPIATFPNAAPKPEPSIMPIIIKKTVSQVLLVLIIQASFAVPLSFSTSGVQLPNNIWIHCFDRRLI
jgi:hypothetical protein